MTRSVWCGAVILAALGYATPAGAHAERSASSPREGATIAAAPEVLRVTFTEPPTGDAAVRVLDGCGRDVVEDVEVQNFEIAARLAAGQPGSWTVHTNVISIVDGHNTRDRWTFGVRGPADCSSPDPPDGDAARDQPDDAGGGSALPLVLLGAAAVALIAVAALLRGRGG